MNRSHLANLVLSATVLFLAGCANVHRIYSPANSPIASLGVHFQDRGEFDVAPKFIKGMRPIYPITKLLNREGGESVLEFTIGLDGRTKDITVISCTQRYFGINARFAVRDWVFSPGMKDGRPVEVRCRIPFTFHSSLTQNDFA